MNNFFFKKKLTTQTNQLDVFHDVSACARSFTPIYVNSLILLVRYFSSIKY